MSDKKNIKQFLRGILDKYSDNTLKAKDVVPDFISQKIGEGFSNAKMPQGYDAGIDPGKFIQAGLNVFSGVDKRLWSKNDVYKDKGDIDNNFKARDFLNRIGFGMSKDKANRFGDNDIEKIMDDKGNNNFELKRGTDIGDRFFAGTLPGTGFDEYADQWANRQIYGDKYETDNPVTIPPPLPITGKIDDSKLSFSGEGQAINPATGKMEYYNDVRLNDPFDYALNKGEKINKPSDLGRVILDQFMEPANFTASKRVFLPEIKKQPKRKVVSGVGKDQTVQDGDII